MSKTVGFSPKDYIESEDGLFFAVVAGDIEAGRVTGYLRYQRQQDRLVKLTSQQAGNLLEQYPDYLYFSESREKTLQGVPVSKIVGHYTPRTRLAELRAGQHEGDPCLAACSRLIALFDEAGLDLKDIGVTGSILIGAQNHQSDIDLVIYERETFSQARTLIGELIKAGALGSLEESDWRESYLRRGCSLEYANYLWHEQRKNNKAVFQGIKFDLTFFDQAGLLKLESISKKCGLATITAKVTDDTFAYDFPATYRIEHERVKQILSFTATYAGQAGSGEHVEAAGMLEETEDGFLQLVIGSDREAEGEYLRVIF